MNSRDSRQILRFGLFWAICVYIKTWKPVITSRSPFSETCFFSPSKEITNIIGRLNMTISTIHSHVYKIRVCLIGRALQCK